MTAYKWVSFNGHRMTCVDVQEEKKRRAKQHTRSMWASIRYHLSKILSRTRADTNCGSSVLFAVGISLAISQTFV
jgi:hypothetical protein